MYSPRSRIAVLLGAIALALLALALAAPITAGKAAGSPAFRLASASATTTPGQPTPTGQSAKVTLAAGGNCANRPPHGSDAYIEFCAPSFNGNVEGPWNSHVTLIGGNFKTPPQAIYLAMSPKTGQIGCTLLQSACLSFDNAAKPSDITALLKQTLFTGFTLTFTWTFPTTLATTGSDYALVAEDQDGKLIISGASFTLLSGQAPCVVAYVAGASPDCSTAQSRSLEALEGQTIQIAGSGWLPGNQAQTINVFLECVTCTPKQAPLKQMSTSGSDQATTGGALGPGSVTLPAGVTGEYRLMASNADKSETFGDTDAQAFMLTIVPHPCVAVADQCVWSGTGTDAPQSIAKGQSVTIGLRNWKPGSTVSVYIVPNMVGAQDCAAKTNTAIAKPQSLLTPTGAMTGSVVLPAKLQVGQTYTICASGQSSVGTDSVFAAVHVRITKAVSHPLLGIFSILALVFSLIGGAAYMMTTRQQAAIPQPVGRR